MCSRLVLPSSVRACAALVVMSVTMLACKSTASNPYGQYVSFAALDTAFQENGTLLELAGVLRPHGWSVGAYDGDGGRWCGQSFFHRELRKQIYATVFCAGGDAISFLEERSLSEIDMQAQVEDTTHWWLKPEEVISTPGPSDTEASAPAVDSNELSPSCATLGSALAVRLQQGSMTFEDALVEVLAKGCPANAIR